MLLVQLASIDVLINFVNSRFFITAMLLQKQPPEVFYKKGALRNFAKFTGKDFGTGAFL